MNNMGKSRGMSWADALQAFLTAALAGVMIGVGGTVYLSCESKALGAFLFCVGLYTICVFGLRLYTGRVGYVLDNKQFGDLGITWIGNLVGTTLCALAVGHAKPALVEKARALSEAKLEQTWIIAILLGIFCGMLMYIAVDAFKRNASDSVGRYLGIMLCVPAFILSGFEHSIADMVYLAMGGVLYTAKGIGYILLVTVGNALGAFIINFVVKKKN